MAPTTPQPDWPWSRTPWTTDGVHMNRQLADARARAAGIAPGELNPDDLLPDDNEDTNAPAAAAHRRTAEWYATLDQNDREIASATAWWTKPAATLDAAAACAGQQPVR